MRICFCSSFFCDLSVFLILFSVLFLFNFLAYFLLFHWLLLLPLLLLFLLLLFCFFRFLSFIFLLFIFFLIWFIFTFHLPSFTLFFFTTIFNVVTFIVVIIDNVSNTVNPYRPVFPFYNPKGFLTFSGGIGIEHWLKIGVLESPFTFAICDRLRDLVAFVQFKKRENILRRVLVAFS